MKKNLFRVSLLLVSVISIYFFIGSTFGREQKADGYYRIVVLADTHLPTKNLNFKEQVKKDKIIAAKNKVLEDINSWGDVGEVAVVGDVTGDTGTTKEYAYAANYFSKLHKPTFFIVGNHDYIYNDRIGLNNHYAKGDSNSRSAKLAKFEKTFGMSQLFYTQKVAGYLLVFLSVDSLTSKHLTEISAKQLAWLKDTLKNNAKIPTIIFFHAPLKGTLHNYNKTVNSANFIAQPEKIIDEILKNNKQVVLWVSGHTHTPATNPSFASDINFYQGRILDVHNADMERITIWTNSLFLYPDKIVIKTFNHKTKKWLPGLERTVPIYR